MSFTDYERYHIHDYIYSIADVDQITESINQDIDDIEKKIAEIKQAVIQLEDDTENMRTEINNMKTIVTKLLTDSEDIENKIEALEDTEIHNLKTGFAQMNFAITKTENDLKTTDTRSRGNDTRLTAIEQNASIEVFYKGKGKHNNQHYVRFYKNSEHLFGVNVNQTSNDFICDNDTKLKIVKPGTYVFHFYDGYRSNYAGNLIVKLDKTAMDKNTAYYEKMKFESSNNNWTSIHYSTIIQMQANTTMEIYLDESSAELDGHNYCRITLFRLMD